MAASPEVMQANGGAPPQGDGQPTGPPRAAPMMTPQNADGAQQGARVKCLLAQKLLEQALPAYGSQHKDGQAILKAITSLAKAFGKQESSTEELAPAEKMQMVQDLAGPGAAPKGPAPGGPPPQPLTGGAPPPPQPGA